MKKYRINALMVGILYLLGTILGVLSSVVVNDKLSIENDMLTQGLNNVVLSALLIIFIGISFIAMTIFLYPILKKDSDELALGVLIFRGIMEGVWYLTTGMGIIVLAIIGQMYTTISFDTLSLNYAFEITIQYLDYLAPLGSIFYLIGVTCLYVSFYRTGLIPKWLTLWGLIAVAPYFIYVFANLFGYMTGLEPYLQFPLLVQEIVMAIWLVMMGFNEEALDKLITQETTQKSLK